ncbi:MAG: deoxyribose-phosphate aldolase [Spirochaetes bacterium RBG_16_67_19]|nr:MAG: deoxyribose-phosphate aldolase [Spirochaetes bacterium RBG_16_67_19]
MTMTARDIARLTDISAVRTPHGEAEIREMVENARRHSFYAVHVLPCWVSFLRELLAASPEVLAGAPVGFPAGAHRTDIKVAEARALVADGVQEMDMMLNVGKLRSGDRRYVLEDIRAVVQAAGALPVKVIIEAPLLADDQIRLACDLCIQGGAAFVKTSTGWLPGGSSLPMLRLITAHVGQAIQVKAAGGIRDVQTLVEMRRLGVARFGINLHTAVQIVTEVTALPGGAVEV